MTAAWSAQMSPAGLTRGSIDSSQELVAKKMDCRVKPGNDDPTPAMTAQP
jgi:hypothetical protein